MEKTKIFGALAFVLFALSGMVIAATGAPSPAISSAAAAQFASEAAGNAVAVENAAADAFVAQIAAEPEAPPLRDFAQTLRVGDIADTGDLRARLSEVGSRNNVRYAAVDILDSNDQVLAQTTINIGSTYTFANERLNKRLRITASQVNVQRQNARLNLVESTLHANAQMLQVNGNLDTGAHVLRLLSVDRNTGEAEMQIFDENNRLRLETIHVMPGASYLYRDYFSNVHLRISVYYSSTEENAGRRWIYVSTRENLITQPQELGIGESFQTAHFSVRLSDVGFPQGENNDNPAILEIRDRRGNLVNEVLVSPGSGYTLVQNNPRYALYIRVYATGPAFNREDRWASIAVTEVRG